MIKIPDAVRDMINKNPTLLWGLSNKLFNLSQLARFIKPLIESRTKKHVQTSAVLMSLSRLQKQTSKISQNLAKFKMEDITINSNLIVLTFEKGKTIKKKINELYNKIEEKNAYICITEGTNEITIIIDEKLKKLLKNLNHKKQYTNISAIGLRFPEKYVDTPGFIYAIVQQLALQNINIIEVCSTYTEIIFYVSKENTRLVFDIIFDQFSGK
ncbi:hypothetical protein HZC20_03630 [Candidatus Peregrinibacteria bacterium]|nr:hypothetical protein [Candidatus Peregrinibacteria bacterium]